MFKQDVTTTYNLEDATYEIVIMLVVAFTLGYFLRHFLQKKNTVVAENLENDHLSEELLKTRNELERSIKEKAELRKSLILEYATQIDDLKFKLQQSREDLEKSLIQRAANHPPEAVAADENSGSDNLMKIEGIGPVLAKLLNKAGLKSYGDLAGTEVDKLKQILSEAGSRYKVHDPTSWPVQSKLAAEGKWEDLKSFQMALNAKV